jgi:hypothetical protein
MKSIKLYAVLLLATLSVVSCQSNKPDNKIHEIRTEQNGWKPGLTVKDTPVAALDTLVQISPNWNQANYYASKRGDSTIHIILGSILLALFVVLFYSKTTAANWLPERLYGGHLGNTLLFVLLVSSVYYYIGNATSIKWNNDKWVKKEVYDKAMQNGSTQQIWDSLENNCLIVDGPYGCDKK